MANNQTQLKQSADQKVTENGYIATEIKTLDTLLGGGFKTGTVNIIKGGPGSGKTTLGLQILNEHLIKNETKGSDISYNSIFISLEVPGDIMVDYINRSYEFKFSDKQYADKFCILSRHELEDALTDSIYGDIITNPVYFIQDKINKKINKDLNTIKDRFKPKNQNIIFIDSLNVFVDILNLKSGFKYDMRALINVICGELPSLEFKKNSIFIFSVEHRGSANHGQSLLSESFLSDTEILLNTEALIGANTKLRNEISANGFEIFADKENKKEVETRPFCRILKSRFSQSQSRRCFYDIKPGKGVEFKEIFPGDGEINLFFENAPQQKYWEDCFKFDLKFSYPALRHTTFDRESLQRTFSSLRHLKHIPEKTDLYFTCLDNYWINWYADLKRKSFIGGVVNDLMREEKVLIEKEQANIIINTIHRELTTNKINTGIIENKVRKQLNPNVEYIKFRNTDKALDPKTDEYDYILKLYMAEAVGKVENEILNILSRYNFKQSFNCNYRVWFLVLLTYFLPDDDMYMKEFIKASILKISDDGKWEKSYIDGILEEIEGKFENKRVDIPYLAEYLNNVFSIICENKCLDEKSNKKNNIVNKYHSFLKNKTKIPDNNNRLLVGLKEDFAKEAHIEEPDKCPNLWVCEKCYQNEDATIKINEACKTFIEKLRTEFKEDLELSVDGETYVANIRLNFSSSDMVTIAFDSFKRLLHVLGEIKNKDLNAKIKRQDLIPCFISAFCNLAKTSKSYLEVIPTHRIRLFGEVKSDIICELSNFNYIENRPLHNSDSLFSMRDKDNYISIPYNANVSYVVYRKDILDSIYNGIDTDMLVNKVMEIYEAEVKLMVDISAYELHLYNHEEIQKKRMEKSSFFERVKRDSLKDSEEEKKANVLIDAMVRQNCAKGVPKTWEEIIALFLLTKESQKPHFLIETRTFDTYMTAFLEFFWSFDGDLHILPDYSIENLEDTFTKLIMAYNLVGLMSHNNIIPQNSTVDAGKINTNNIKEGENWVFARHWHSTFVDFLTCEKNEAAAGTNFFANNQEARFELMPIPTSLFTYIHKGHMTKHISSWGDWHFAIIKGSENTNLGLDIINNLMSSYKISERAFSAAELPTVEKFYKLHGDTTCFNMEDIKSECLPKTTFNQMRHNFFKNAKCRSQIFDYRHTISELGAIFQYAHFGAYPSSQRENLIIPQNNLLSKKIYKRLNDAFEIIQNFVKEDIMRN